MARNLLGNAMAENEDSVTYLKLLKQFGAAPAATGAAPAREAGPAELETNAPAPVPDQRFEGPEKRRSPRYKCEGSVELREEGVDVRTWASFSDISLHGCYVEAQATYPVGTILRMKLEADGIRVESKGNVRVNYPYLGMGIAFTEMSEDNQNLLRELLRKVSRPSVIVGPGIASTLPSVEPLTEIPPIANPAAAVEALAEFFENRQMLMREDFVRLLKKSQGA